MMVSLDFDCRRQCTVGSGYYRYFQAPSFLFYYWRSEHNILLWSVSRVVSIAELPARSRPRSLVLEASSEEVRTGVHF